MNVNIRASVSSLPNLAQAGKALQIWGTWVDGLCHPGDGEGASQVGLGVGAHLPSWQPLGVARGLWIRQGLNPVDSTCTWAGVAAATERAYLSASYLDELDTTNTGSAS